MADKLGVYNGTLRLMGERKLASLTEDLEARRVLDEAFPDAVQYALGQGFWRFALRNVRIVSDPNVARDFGYQAAFAKPEDLVRLHAISSDEFMNIPLIHWQEEGGWWLSHDAEIFVSYVSNDSLYGGSLTAWTPNFLRYLQYHLATEIVERLAPSTDVGKLEAKKDTALKDALSKDAMQTAPVWPMVGGWGGLRGGGSLRGDRGRRDRLLG